MYRIEQFEIINKEDDGVNFKVVIFEYRFFRSPKVHTCVGFAHKFEDEVTYSRPISLKTGNSFHVAFTFEISQAIERLCKSPDALKEEEADANPVMI